MKDKRTWSSKDYQMAIRLYLWWSSWTIHNIDFPSRQQLQRHKQGNTVYVNGHIFYYFLPCPCGDQMMITSMRFCEAADTFITFRWDLWLISIILKSIMKVCCQSSIWSGWYSLFPSQRDWLFICPVQVIFLLSKTDIISSRKYIREVNGERTLNGAVSDRRSL